MRKTLLLILFPFYFTSSWAYDSDLAQLVHGDYAAKADSLTSVLISQFMNQTTGTFYSTPFDVDKSSTYIYWQQAHAMDVLIYGYERHKDDDSGLSNRYRLHMINWYRNHANNYKKGDEAGSTGFKNPYTDDMAWICLTLLHMGEATGTKSYTTTAKKVFDSDIIRRAKEDERGFWLPWNDSNGSGPNACTEAPACLVALKLYLFYNDEKYLNYANKLYSFTIKNICEKNNKGNLDGRVEEPPLTYTQGTFGEASRLFFHITGDSTYRDNAGLFIKYAFTSNRCTSNGLLRGEGSSMDQSIFKAVLIPYAANFCIDETMPYETRKLIIELMQTNANALWKNLDKPSYPAMYCPYYWGEPYDKKTASMGAMTSGASLMENVTRMCIALTTEPSEDSILSPLKPNKPQSDCVYSLGGRLVRSHTTDTRGLPSGIYIVNGKTIVVH